MFNVKILNNIEANLGDGYTVDSGSPDAILVRSANLHDYSFEPTVECIVRAGAGVNNIPVGKCSDAGIVVFNTPGANANAVKELAIAALILAGRDIAGGIRWTDTLVGTDGIAAAVEKGKSSFAGPELYKKTLGVIGLGAIGALVANIGISLGMKIIGHDPFMSVDAAWRIDRHVQQARDIKTIFETCDYISLHLPVTSGTKGFINSEILSQCKKGVRFVNLARAELVNDADMLAAIESGIVARYVTDFPNETLAGRKGVVCIPHLGASTPESEENCAVMALRQMQDFLETGNIKNSVNYPSIDEPMGGLMRVCVAHRNVPNIITQISSAMGALGINISNLSNKSRGEYAYTILDIDSVADSALITNIRAIDGVLRVRTIKHN